MTNQTQTPLGKNISLFSRIRSFQGLFYHYRPQRSCAKVMFTQASVTLFTGSVWQTPLPLGRPLSPTTGQTPPQQTATAADGTHPTGMHSCCLLYVNRFRSRSTCFCIQKVLRIFYQKVCFGNNTYSGIFTVISIILLSLLLPIDQLPPTCNNDIASFRSQVFRDKIHWHFMGMH